MKKNCLLATMLMLLSTAVSAQGVVASGNCGLNAADNLQWTLTANSDDGYMLTITGEGKMNNYQNSNQPSDMTAPWASYRENITTIILPEGLTDIGAWAFYKTKITTIELPSTLKNIEYDAFSNSSITSVILPEGLEAIGNRAFKYTPLTTITIPSTLKSWYEDVFTDSNLSDIYVTSPTPLDLTTINLFKGLTLGNITLHVPSTFTEEEVLCYKTAPIWKNLNFPVDGVLEPLSQGTCGAEGDGSNLRWYYYMDSNLIAQLKIYGEGRMRDYTSNDKSELRPWITTGNEVRVTFPERIENIGAYAFEYTRLQHMDIPASVTSIGDYAFANYGSYTVGTYETINIPSTVKHIGSYAFSKSRVKNVDIPESLETWGANVFDNANILESITVSTPTPLDLTAINMFAGLDLSTVTLRLAPELDESVFYAYAAAPVWTDFKNLADIHTVNAQGTCGAEGDNMKWAVVNGNTLCIYGKGRMADFVRQYIAYETPWKDYQKAISTIELSGDIESIGSYAFEDCNITSITIPSTLTSIGDKAFYCSKIQAIDLSTTLLTSIGASAFNNCQSLNAVSLPASLQQLGTMAFANMNGGTITLRSLPQMTDETLGYNADILLTLTDSDKPYLKADATFAHNKLQASYTRTLAAGKYGTIVLPFVPKSTEGLTFYTPKSMTAAEGGYILFEPVETVEAGVPYLISNETGSETFTITADGTTVTTATTDGTADGFTMSGTFQKKTFTADDNVFFIKDNAFYRFASAAPATLTMNPFRGYFTSTAASATALGIRISDGLGTHIEPTIIDTDTDDTYDLQGRLVAQPTQGIYIINGKKVLFK